MELDKAFQFAVIEQGAPLPESLRFESEPWTLFYRVGEIIRQLRKALENNQIRERRQHGLFGQTD